MFFECLKNVFVPVTFIIPQKMYIWSCGPPFHTYYSSISICSLSVIVCCTCGRCPEHLRLTHCMSGSSPAANQVHRPSMDANWTSTRQGKHKFRTKCMPAHSYRTSSRAFSGGARSKFCATFSGLNGPCLTRSAFAE